MGELTGSGQTYTVGKYTVFNNDWDVGSLIIGQDFTETISYNDNGLQSGVVMSWSYPDTPPASGDGVYAYPE